MCPTDDVLPTKKTYFWFKLHSLATIDGFITDFILTLANVDDQDAILNLSETYKYISIIGDKGYINKTLSPELKSEKGILLIFMKRDNYKEPLPKWLRQQIFKLIRRVVY